MTTPREVTSLDPALVASRLGMCAAALAGAAAAPHAQAVVITFNTTIPLAASTAGVYINFLTGATGSSASAVPGWDFNPYLASGGTQLGFYWGLLPTAGNQPSGSVAASAGGPSLNLPIGSVIGPGSTFNNSIIGQTNGSPYITTGTHILGFRFHNETTNAVNYGYLTMQTTAGTGFPGAILGWSYENNGSAITVVPEPSTGLMLSAGALALGAVQLRRRRKERAAALAH